MQEIKLMISKVKKNSIPIAILIFIICLLVFSNSNLPAVRNGLNLFANSVIPALFPFFIATEMLMHTNIVNQLGYILNPIMKPLFNVSGKGAFALVMGIISGYPVGAKIAANFRQNNICSKEECERLLSFTNNSGPLFIIGTVGISMFGNTTIGILLFITHLLASIVVGIVFRFWKSKNYRGSIDNIINNSNTSLRFSNLGEILSDSISSSISTIFMIGGFIIVFSTLISILNASGLIDFVVYILSPIFNFFNINLDFINGLFTGIFEITNGINIICNIHIKNISFNIILVAFLLGFGGISVMLQVFGIISKTDLSIKPYVYGKLLHGFLAGFFTWLFINYIPMFNFDLILNI